MVSQTDVTLAFRLILGREPDNPQLVERMAITCDTLDKLRNRLMGTKEFQRRFGEGGDNRRLLAGGPPQVDVFVPPEQQERLLAHVEEVWRGFGETQPHWSVLTNQMFKPDRLEENRAYFYATGENSARLFQEAVERAGVDFRKLRSCLELGCGVGRVTVWLAELFDRVAGADISAPHMELAAQAVRERGRENVTFHRVASRAEIARLPEADAFFSVISLQHSPPPVMAVILEACLSRLRPGGVGHFQIPVAIVGYRFRVDEYLAGQAQLKEMEHHCLPQPALFRVIERAGCRVLDMQDDTHSRVGKLSNTVTVQKVRPALRMRKEEVPA